MSDDYSLMICFMIDDWGIDEQQSLVILINDLWILIIPSKTFLNWIWIIDDLCILLIDDLIVNCQ
jgi:hypothetical protein